MNRLERERARHLEGRLRPGICYADSPSNILFGDDAPDMPGPDPAIGQAALMNAELAREMAAIAREELAYRKQRDAELDPMFKELAQQQLTSSRENAARAGEAWDRYKTTGIPAEDAYLQAASEVGSEADQARAAGRAVADVDQQFDTADQMYQREMARTGGTVSDGANTVGRRLALLGRAGARAGAATRAAEGQRLLGLAAKEGAAKFVRGLPSQGLAADSAAINAGNAATGAVQTQTALHNTGVQLGTNIMGGSGSMNTQAGNLYLGQYGAQMRGYEAAMHHDAARMQAIGEMYGAAFGAAAAGGGGGAGRKDGGPIHRRPRLLGYAGGGKVSGPGGPRDDAIPAVIDGVDPAALSDGEFVINAEATQNVYGEEALQDVNEGKALVIPSKVLAAVGRERVRSLVLAFARRPARAPVTG